MTLADVSRLFRHWRVYPPTHRLVAAYFGIGPQAEAAKPQYMDADAFANFVKITGGQLPGISG